MNHTKMNALKQALKVSTTVVLGSIITGCASWTLDKSVQPAAADVQHIRNELPRVRQLHQAVYDVATFAADRCERKYAREPLALFTVGHLTNEYNKEQLAAYYQAAGFDETWRVLWADPSTGLKEGEQVVEINGEAIENNKSGLGEYPAVKYVAYSSVARDDAAKGKPYVVTMADGRKITIPTKAACRSNLFNNPLLKDEYRTSVPMSPQFAMQIAPTAVTAAMTEDEYRYLAGIVVYYQASVSAKWRDRSGNALLMVGSAAALAMPVLYGAIAVPTMLVNGKIRETDMTASSAAFASKVVADMGGDPYAGLNFVNRLASQHIKADRVLLDEDQRNALRAYLDSQYKPGDGGAPKKAAGGNP